MPKHDVAFTRRGHRVLSESVTGVPCSFSSFYTIWVRSGKSMQKCQWRCFPSGHVLSKNQLPQLRGNSPVNQSCNLHCPSAGRAAMVDVRRHLALTVRAIYRLGRFLRGTFRRNANRDFRRCSDRLLPYQANYILTIPWWPSIQSYE